jgi:hypothetical protein
MAGKLPTISFVSKKGSARYPKISKPDTEGKYADGRFKTDMILEGAALEHADAAAKAAAAKFWPKAETVTLPVKDFKRKNKDTGEVTIDGRGLVATTKRRPAVFDAKKTKLPEGVEIGGGSEIRISGYFFPWDKTTKMQVKEGGKVTTQDVTEYGVSFRMCDVQVISLAAGFGGDGSAFDEEEGFEYEGTSASADGSSAFDDDADAL